MVVSPDKGNNLSRNSAQSRKRTPDLAPLPAGYNVFWIDSKSKKKQAEFWDSRSRQYDQDMQQHDADYGKTIDLLGSLLTDVDIVLDFGCASGEISLDIASQVRQVHGIDLSGKMIALARQKAADRQVDNVRFDQAQVFSPVLEKNTFSAVVAFNIFHLVGDAAGVLSRIHELLRTDGLLISQTPCLAERGWLFRSLIGLAQKTGLAPPIRSFRIQELESLMPASHFTITESMVWDEKNAVQWIVCRKVSPAGSFKK